MLAPAPGCGLLADAFSDALQVDVETEILARKELGKPTVQLLQFYAVATHTSPTYQLPMEYGGEGTHLGVQARYDGTHSSDLGTSHMGSLNGWLLFY